MVGERDYCADPARSWGWRSRGEKVDDPGEPEPWWKKALVAALAGLLFSLTMSAVLSLGSAFRVAPLVAVERAGIDFGMLAYTAFAGRPKTSEKEPNYIFVDVDRAACEAFSPDASACIGDRPVPPALTIAFAKAARHSGASVVVIDVRAPDGAADRADLANALAAPDGPWVIASLGVRPRLSDKQMKVVANSQTLLGPAAQAPLRSGRLLLAPFLTATDAFAADGIVRHYPLLEQVEGLGREGAVRWLPSAPFLASRLADSIGAGALICLYYRRESPGCDGVDASTSSTVIQFGERTDLRNRIFYSLPSLAAAGPEQRSIYRDRYLGFYDRIVASDLIESGTFIWPRELMAGAIVIFGSSAPEAHDWHVTPLGPMAGPEILFNAIRAFSEFAPLSEPTFTASSGERLVSAWRGFILKVGAMSTGTLIMLVGWFAIFWISDRWTAAPLWLNRTACVLIFFFSLGVTATFELFTGISALERNAQVAESTDLLTPLLALGLEGFAEAARTFAQASETVVGWALSKGLILARKAKGKPSDDTV